MFHSRHGTFLPRAARLLTVSGVLWLSLLGVGSSKVMAQDNLGTPIQVEVPHPTPSSQGGSAGEVAVIALLVLGALALWYIVSIGARRSAQDLKKGLEGRQRRKNTEQSDRISCRHCGADFPAELTFPCDRCGFTGTRNLASACPKCRYRATSAECPRCGHTIEFG